LHRTERQESSWKFIGPATARQYIRDLCQHHHPPKTDRDGMREMEREQQWTNYKPEKESK